MQPTIDTGRPFSVTNRLVLSIALPMMLAYLTTPLLGIVDTAVIGQFGDAALLGGLAAGAIVFDVVFSSFNFLRAGTTGLVSQAFGRDDREAEKAHLWRAIAVALVCGLTLVVLSPAVAAAGVWFMDGGPRVSEALSTYVGIRLLCAPVALCNYAILGYFIGRGEAGMALGLQILLNGINIVLSIVLGLRMGWGVEGVAWATVAGEAIACAAGFLIILARFRGESLHLRRSLTAIAELRRMLALNGDIMIRSFVLLAAFALLTRQGAQLGTLTLAVNAVLMNFFLVAGYFLDGYATAAEQIAGRAVGAGREREFRAAVRLTGIWGFATAAVVAVLVLIWGDALVALITTSPEVRAEAAVYLPWAALTAVSGVLAFQMDGVFIGATWSRDMRNMMLVSFAIFVVALLVLPSLAANHGLWAALHVFLLARGVSLYAIMSKRIVTAFPRHASTEADAH